MTEFNIPATLTDNGRTKTITTFDSRPGGGIKVADEFHPHWNRILEGLRKGDPEVFDLFDVADTMIKRFRQVTERVAWNGSDVLWDGTAVHNSLTDHLVRVMESGANANNYTAIAKFWEKLESNPEEHSRVQAYDWLAAHNFQITLEGDIVGYKGVTTSSDENGKYFASWARSQVPGKASAFINGNPVQELSNVFPQRVGDVVTLPREEVEHDPRHACKRGLHVAVYGYAKGYGDTVLEVHVNPRDVVSVPTDGGGEKVRTCRYTIASVSAGVPDQTPISSQASGPVVFENVSTRV